MVRQVSRWNRPQYLDTRYKELRYWYRNLYKHRTDKSRLQGTDKAIEVGLDRLKYSESKWRPLRLKSDMLQTQKRPVVGSMVGRRQQRSLYSVDERQNSSWKARDKLLHISRHLQDSSDFGDSAYHTWNTALIDFSNDLIGCQFQVGSRAIEGSTADSDYGTRDPTNWIICVGRTHGAGGIHAR